MSANILKISRLFKAIQRRENGLHFSKVLVWDEIGSDTIGQAILNV